MRDAPRLTLIELGLLLGSLALVPVAGPAAGGAALAGSAVLAGTIRRLRQSGRMERYRRLHELLADADIGRDPLVAQAVGGYLLVRRFDRDRYYALPAETLDEREAVAVLRVELPEPDRLAQQLAPWAQSFHPIFEGLLGQHPGENSTMLVFPYSPSQELLELERPRAEVLSLFSDLLEGFHCCWERAHDPGLVRADRVMVSAGQPSFQFVYRPAPNHNVCLDIDHAFDARAQAPERVAGRSPFDARTTQFELGLLLYWALAHRHPFEAEDPLQIIMKVLQDEPPPLNLENPALEALVMRMLAKDPSARFPSLALVAAELRQIAEASAHNAGLEAGQ